MLWIEAYLSEHPDTVILDPLDRVAKCINRITTLEVLEGYDIRSNGGLAYLWLFSSIRDLLDSACRVEKQPAPFFHACGDAKPRTHMRKKKQYVKRKKLTLVTPTLHTQIVSDVT